MDFDLQNEHMFARVFFATLFDPSDTDTSADADSWTPPEWTPEEWAEFEAELATESALNDALIEEALRSWSPPDERAELFDAWNRAESAMMHLFDAINRWDAADTYALDGARSPSAWLRANLTISGAHASRLLSLARGLRANPRLRFASGDGTLSTDQVDQLLFVFTPARAAYVARDAAAVIGHVAPLTVKQTGIVANHWAERVDAIHKRGWTITGNPNATLYFHSPTGHSYSSDPPNLPLPQLE